MSDKILKVSDIVEITAKSALSVIPIGGTLISCVWDSIKANCAQKRLDDWKQLLEERLVEIGDTLESIGSNECFATAMMKATDSAIKTMEEQKRRYLANAVINSVTCEFEESVMMMYFDFIDKYTLWHIKILHFFVDPTKFEGVSKDKYYMGSPMEPLCTVYPELRSNKLVVDKIIKELFADRLMNTENINVTMTAKGMFDSRTTEFGNAFIKFLSRGQL